MVDYAALRRNMVDCQLRPNDITDLRILEAMDVIPKEAFVPEHLRGAVYVDNETALVSPQFEDAGRAMPTAITLASLVQGANIKGTDFVLDVGCLTGYSAAVLAHLADSVVALEANEALVREATDRLNDLQIMNVAVVEGPLDKGQPSQGPFDVILINGAVEDVPQTLFDQLKDGGRLVTVLIENGFGRAVRYIKTGEISSGSSFGDLSAPLLAAFVKEREFSL